MFARPGRHFCSAGALTGLLCLSPVTARALNLAFPGTAVQTFSRAEALSSYALPTGPWADGALPTREVEGPRTQVAWRIAASGMTTVQLLAPLRDQLAKQGYKTLWECETDACGGFDFRYSTEVLPEPDMHVDLGDFRFLTAQKNGLNGPEIVSILVSRSSEKGFVQMISVGGAAPETPTTANAEPAPEPPTPPAASDVAGQLLTGGSVALDDLTFESSSANLGPGDFPSLDALAAFLKANPDKTVALVGHTDASGGLAGNTTLSKARASSVRDRLVQALGVAAGQVSAEGVGYLAPRASNLTEEGRARNRRVEVILTSTQ